MFDEIVEFDNLYSALKKSCKNVRWKDSVVGYEHNGLKNTYILEKSIETDTYTIDKYQKFNVYEPKKRTIVATRLKDRQFQRAMCDGGLYNELTRSFISDNCACLKGRGVDYCLNRTTMHLRKFYTKHKDKGWVLKCDIRGYFQNINHNVAKAAVDKIVRDKRVVKCVFDIIDSFDGDMGIGLGSQISQLIALAVLDDLDHIIKERLRIKHYIRYMDDILIIHEDKRVVDECLHIIQNELEKLGLELNDKTSIHGLKHGFKFLQWKFYLTDSGKIVKKIDRKKLSKQRRRMKKIYKKELAGIYPKGATEESLKSFIGNAKRGHTYFQIIRMVRYYNRLTKKDHLTI